VLNDLIARVFIIGFFVAYLVVGILVVQWIFRTWFGRATRRVGGVESQTPKRAPQPEPPAPESTVPASQNVQSRADSGSLSSETPRHGSTTA
jgi:hypothetical protein